MDGWEYPLSRRRLLAASAAGAAAIAGCGGTNARNERAAARRSLGYVRVVNEDEADHTVHIMAEREDEMAFWSSYDLGGANSISSPLPVKGPWVDDGGAYTLYFRLDDDAEWTTFDTESTDADCYGLEVRVENDELGLWTEQRPAVCSTGTETTAE
ncbi:hypothetical protein [Halogeometricum luteum]|uniref:Tat (Twin-arginine translocation) pathway signal sequence n=1 Tax=Halogeometricum luteum TaxID=2950537 RepID=A0ABU2FZJ3_9EURY|nr:hypothetical protein [Halogeometricum sp. S3BR5-2]MDS0293955.1 hypothetical protein [Halogeometricum sp. S3BR5-2]